MHALGNSVAVASSLNLSVPLPISGTPIIKYGGHDMNNFITLQPLTLYELISLTVSIIGFTLVVFTLWFMQRQTSAMHKQAELMSSQVESGVASMKSSAYQSYATQMFTIDTIFLRYPKLRPYFHSRVKVEDGNPDYDRIIAISELFLDYIDTVLIEEEQLPDLWPSNKWDPYFREMFNQSPVLCTYLEKHKEWYTDQLIKLMEDGIKSLEQ
jgi:hypothetical protein